MSYAVDSFLWTRSQDARLADGEPLDLTDYRVVQFAVDDMARIIEHVSTLPEDVKLEYAPDLPFERTWFGADRLKYLGYDEVGSDQRVAAVALVCAGRDLHMVTTSPDGRHMAGTLFRNGQIAPGAAEPATRAWGLVVHALCAAADRAYGLVVRTELDGARRRKAAARAKAPIGHVPREFYRVEIRDSTRWVGDAKLGIEGVGRAWRVGHRHDVRSHWRVLVQRGQRDDMALRRKLEARGYMISVYDGDLDDHTDELVRSRGVRLRHGEFIAVLKVRVKPHTRGPVEAPLVPACWRLRVREPQISE